MLSLPIYYCYGLARYIKLTVFEAGVLPQEVLEVLEETSKIKAPISSQGEYFIVCGNDCKWMEIFVDLGEKSKIFNLKYFLLAGSKKEIKGTFIAKIATEKLKGLDTRGIQKAIQEVSFSSWNHCMGVVDKERATVLRGIHEAFGDVAGG